MERSRDNIGALSQLGASNHRAIAKRLSQRHRKVFRTGRKVRCVSTDRPRCIVSMGNAANALAASRPGLEIDMSVSKKFLCYKQPPTVLEHLLELRDSMFAAHPGVYDCIKSCFTNPSGLSIKDLHDVAEAVYYVWEDLPCLGLEPFDIRKYFSEEMLLMMARHYTSWDYCLLSNSEWWHPEWLKPITDDIVDRADEALERGDIAADLRFGHDSQLIPLFTLLGLSWNGPMMSYAEAPYSWDVATVCPMTSNLQIVFYRNRKGSVLVKVLKNECEVQIPSLTPVKGPYYRWEDLAGLLKNV